MYCSDIHKGNNYWDTMAVIVRWWNCTDDYSPFRQIYPGSPRNDHIFDSGSDKNCANTKENCYSHTEPAITDRLILAPTSYVPTVPKNFMKMKLILAKRGRTSPLRPLGLPMFKH